MPSYLFFDVDKNRVYTGEYAKDIYVHGDRPLQTVTAVKTRIGTDSVVEIPSIATDKKEQFDMTQCSAFLLKTIMDSFKAQHEGQEITNVVITVPAAFSTDERVATVNAALLAGFREPKILDEPTATLLYYINGGDGIIREDSFIKDESNILVYDLGGGTLDVCIAKVYLDDNGDVTIDIISRSPREDFGGNDFDQRLGAYILYDWEKARASIETRSKEDQNAIISRIVSHAEAAKIEMSDFIWDNLDDPKRLQRRKKSFSFEVMAKMKADISLNKEILDTIYLPLTEPHGRLLKPVKQCLGEANLDKDQIDQVILTGGMTKYYAVYQTLKDFFGDKIIEVMPLRQ